MFHVIQYNGCFIFLVFSNQFQTMAYTRSINVFKQDHHILQIITTQHLIQLTRTTTQLQEETLSIDLIKMHQVIAPVLTFYSSHIQCIGCFIFPMSPNSAPNNGQSTMAQSQSSNYHSNASNQLDPNHNGALRSGGVTRHHPDVSGEYLVFKILLKSN